MTSALSGENRRDPVVPFLKWAGGKRWLAHRIRLLVPQISSIAGTYVEPFLGSGAMYFSLLPERAILNDINRDLIETYRAIRGDPSAVMRNLRRYQASHSKDFYYQIRARRPRTKAAAAARFLYLNRTCWNGLYRVNLDGQFNVPIGTKSAVILETDDFDFVSSQLSRARLTSCDFTAAIAKAGEGDLVFADPPYTVKHNLNGFLKYNERLFSWGDQVRLKDALCAAVRRGARVVVSNADHESIRSLYSTSGFETEVVQRCSVISGNKSKRKTISELLLVGGFA